MRAKEGAGRLERTSGCSSGKVLRGLLDQAPLLQIGKLGPREEEWPAPRTSPPFQASALSPTLILPYNAIPRNSVSKTVLGVTSRN